MIINIHKQNGRKNKIKVDSYDLNYNRMQDNVHCKFVNYSETYIVILYR